MESVTECAFVEPISRPRKEFLDIGVLLQVKIALLPKDVEWKEQEIARGSPASSPIPEHYKFINGSPKNMCWGNTGAISCSFYSTSLITATMLVGNNCTDVLFCRKCELRMAVLRRSKDYLSSHARNQKPRTRDSLEDDYQMKLNRHGDERGKNFRGVTGPNIYRNLKVDSGLAMAQCLSHDLFEGAIKVSLTFGLTQRVFENLLFVQNHT